MLTRKLTLLVFLSFICFMGFAQNNNMDEVYLNNGSIFKGEIVEYKLGDELTFKLGDEQILVFNDKDILKIIQADGTVINPATANADIKEDAVTMEAGKPVREKKPFKLKSKGWYNSTYIAFAAGNDGTNGGDGDFKLGSGLHNIFGKQFTRMWGLGLGIGLDNYSRRGETVVPVYLELRGYPLKKQQQYYYALAGGYGFTFKRESFGITETEGGLMVHPAVGIRLGTPDGTNVNIDLGYKIQEAFFIEQLFSGDIEERDVTFQRIVLRVGMTLWK